MKSLGIDYGEKRIGIAVSDESQTYARELTILSPKVFWEQIQDIVKEHEVGAIALGLPLNMQGEETKKTLEVNLFKGKLETLLGIPVYSIDERLSSVMAMNMPGGKKDVDSLAAQIILQNWLNKRIAQD